jgi:type II secretion system protein J
MKRSPDKITRLRWRPGGGFTLIELLVGMSISTLILGAAAGVFVTTLNTWDQGGRRARLIQTAQATGDLIERRLRSAVPPSGNDPFVFEGEDLSTEGADGHRLTFLASAGGQIPRAQAPTDLSEVELVFDPAGDDALSMRLESPPEDLLDEGGYRITLSPLVKDFSVLYFDGTEWVEEWSENRLPRAVEFHLTFEEDARSLERGKQPYTAQVSRLVTLPMAEETGTMNP